MMATTPALRFLLSRGSYTRKSTSPGIDRSSYIARKQLDLCRYASSQPPPSTPTRKPRALEKPSRFNPPSHPARLNRPPPRNFPGPRLSPQQMEERAKKRYPHSMPEVGTFMFWFLTNRMVHMCICLSVLFSLAAFTFVTNFRRNSPFASLLPPGKVFIAHPWHWMMQWYHVAILSTDRNTVIAAAKRRKRQEDVERRRAFRKAHGTERAQQGIFPWIKLAEKEDESGSAVKPDGTAVAGAEQASSPEQNEAVAGENPQSAPKYEPLRKGEYYDFEGNRRPPVKRWFGIWS